MSRTRVQALSCSCIRPGESPAHKCLTLKSLIRFRRIPHSDRATEQVPVLAQRHPHTKFVSIVGDKCIPNLPDSRLPMFIIYRRGEVLNQLVSWGADRERRIEGTLC